MSPALSQSITVLPEHVANQIAAGEVVEGASSVVKELVENSLDSGADRISITIAKQLRYIKVADNGNGIPETELPLAFKRHATSKILDIDDIYSLITNGFRGEALASISSVSKLTCISKVKGAEHASKIYIEGDTQELSETGASVGTSIEVDELFYNTPARLKFMKSTNKERFQIIDLIKGYALFNPEIGFELKIDNKLNFKCPPKSDMSRRVVDILGKSALDVMLPLEYNTGDLKLTGFVSLPEFNRSDKRFYYTAINSRLLKCPVIRSAIDKVYRDILPSKKYPVIVLNLDIAREDVDVNVHPRKQEVKYKNTNYIYKTLVDAIYSSISDHVYSSHHQLSLNSYGTNSEAINHSTGESVQETSGSSESTKIDGSSDFSFKQRSPANLAKHSFTPLLSPKPNFEFASKSQLLSEKLKDKSEPEQLSSLNEEVTSSQFEGTQKNKTFLERFPAFELYSVNPDFTESDFNYDADNEFVLFRDLGNAKEKLLLKAQKCSSNEILNNIYKKSLEQFLIQTALEFNECFNKKKTLEYQNPGQSITIDDFHEEDEMTSSNKLSRPLSKIPKYKLEEIWQRDNYTCVYCGKLLIHPDKVKEALKVAEPEFFEWLNSKNQISKEHVIERHKASFDHHLPASKYPSLNLDTKNLHAVCIECNKKKSNSLATKTWSVNPSNSWEDIDKDRPFTLAGVKFISATDFLSD
ncbi:MAG: DNA mismatch repair endonuclease MutL [Candidatus Caenarcaniphilales bacterium]|nr:DNA mismatch repair endonuclease MutL [Candidatus Caenarcaniphilales bacterium]